MKVLISIEADLDIDHMRESANSYKDMHIGTSTVLTWLLGKDLGKTVFTDRSVRTDFLKPVFIKVEEIRNG